MEPAWVEEHGSSAFWALWRRLQSHFLRLLLLSESGVLTSLTGPLCGLTSRAWGVLLFPDSPPLHLSSASSLPVSSLEDYFFLGKRKRKGENKSPLSLLQVWFYHLSSALRYPCSNNACFCQTPSHNCLLTLNLLCPPPGWVRSHSSFQRSSINICLKHPSQPSWQIHMFPI